MQFSSKLKIRIATGLAVLLSKWRITTRYFRYVVFRILPGNKAYYDCRDIRIAVEVNSEWEFERLTSGARSFERYPLDQCLENGLSSESSVYYELGACTAIGGLAMSQFLAKDRISVVIFEPNHENIRSIGSNILLHKHKNLLLMPFALSDEIKVTSLYLDNARPAPGQGGHSIIYDDLKGQYFVPAFTLDAAIEFLGLPPPTHISIDTEGAELSVLKGMTDVLSGRYSTVEVVVVELLGVSSPTSHLITDFMDQYSYEIKNYVSSPVGVVEHCIVTFGKKTREK